MARPSHQLLSAALIGSGGLVYALTGQTLGKVDSIHVPLNPLGICRSPYGEVFAMAMQSPIDTYWHGRLGEEDHDHDHGAGHVHDESCSHDHEEKPAPAASTLNARFSSFLDQLGDGVNARTNHKQLSPAFDFYLRRQIEDKLKFAYQLDPAHYANYNTYHFFLTQPTLGTRPELTPSAAKLAEDTIHYCLQDQNDPRPALTAAGAVCNMMELLFEDYRSPQPRFTLQQIQENLKLLDFCIARHRAISAQWDATGNWDLLSPMRQQEAKDRFSFILKMREASQTTITRLEKEASGELTPPTHQGLDLLKRKPNG